MIGSICICMWWQLARTYSYAHSWMHKGWNCGDFFDEGITNGASWYSLSKGKQNLCSCEMKSTEVFILSTKNFTAIVEIHFYHVCSCLIQSERQLLLYIMWFILSYSFSFGVHWCFSNLWGFVFIQREGLTINPQSLNANETEKNVLKFAVVVEIVNTRSLVLFRLPMLLYKKKDNLINYFFCEKGSNYLSL